MPPTIKLEIEVALYFSSLWKHVMGERALFMWHGLVNLSLMRREFVLTPWVAFPLCALGNRPGGISLEQHEHCVLVPPYPSTFYHDAMA